MKIGIFGDSFAKLKFNPTLAWYEILAQKYDVTNYGWPGSTMFYSVEHFKRHHHEYDKVIYIITQPGRIQFSEDIAEDLSESFIPSNSQLAFLEYRELQKTYPNNERLKTIAAAHYYFLYLQNWNYEVYIQELMVQDIMAMRSDTILIDGFPQSRPTSTATNNLQAISDKEADYWGYNGQRPTPEKDIRNCHFTVENNEIFAGKVEEWLNGKSVHINPDEFVTPNNKEFYIK